ncbi:MAG: COX15/CtaA family protein [Candidatus Kapabacteria bacterium]|nr:COX15/CtaA family protein [Candidatus Kapabacteria bacterium]
MTYITDTSRSLRMLNIVSIVLCVLTFGLIVWGGHVNTTRSGMAFPDWPTSNLSSMVTYQPSEWLWAKDRFWEHGHRLFASVVGVVTTVLLLVAVRATPPSRRPHRALGVVIGVVLATIITAVAGINLMPPGFMETFMIGLGALLVGFLFKSAKAPSESRLVWLAMSAFVGVCLQGTFGGYTVRNNLPDWTSTTHGVLAEIFFMIVIGIALLTSRSWNAKRSQPSVKRSTMTFVAVTWGLTFLQFILGALTRHTDSWGVSLNFPMWSDVGFFPTSDQWQYSQVAIHFVHRTMAYLVAVMVVAQYFIVRKDGAPRDVRRSALVAVLLVLVQILLGAMILWTFRGELVTTLHVMTGMSLLILNTITMFSTFRRPLSQVSSETVQGVVAEQGGH